MWWNVRWEKSFVQTWRIVCVSLSSFFGMSLYEFKKITLEIEPFFLKNVYLKICYGVSNKQQKTYSWLSYLLNRVLLMTTWFANFKSPFFLFPYENFFVHVGCIFRSYIFLISFPKCDQSRCLSDKRLKNSSFLFCWYSLVTNSSIVPQYTESFLL